MGNQETNYKECEGCKGCSPPDVTTRATCTLKPYYINIQDCKIECPCQTCLIKMVCKNPCDELQTYYYSYSYSKYRP